MWFLISGLCGLYLETKSWLSRELVRFFRRQRSLPLVVAHHARILSAVRSAASIANSNNRTSPRLRRFYVHYTKVILPNTDALSMGLLRFSCTFTLDEKFPMEAWIVAVRERPMIVQKKATKRIGATIPIANAAPVIPVNKIDRLIATYPIDVNENSYYCPTFLSLSLL